MCVCAQSTTSRFHYLPLVASLSLCDVTMTAVLFRMISMFLLFSSRLEIVGSNVRYLDVFDSKRMQERGSRSNHTRIEYASASLHMCVCIGEWLNTVRLIVGLLKFFCVDVDLPKAAICNQDCHCLSCNSATKSSFLLMA